jgi:hypothetical protein
MGRVGGYHAPNRSWNPKPQRIKEESSSSGFGQDDMDSSTWSKFEERSIEDWEKVAEQYIKLHSEQSKREKHISKMNDTMIKERWKTMTETSSIKANSIGLLK